VFHRDLAWWQMGTLGEPLPAAILTAFLKHMQSVGLLWRAASVDTSTEMQGQKKDVPLAVLSQVAPSSNNLQVRKEIRNLMLFFFFSQVSI